MAFTGNAKETAAYIDAIDSKGFRFTIDLDTPLSNGHRSIGKKPLISYLCDSPTSRTYQVVILSSARKIMITETRNARQKAV